MKFNNLFEVLEAVLKRYKYDFDDPDFEVLYSQFVDCEVERRVVKRDFREALTKIHVNYTSDDLGDLEDLGKIFLNEGLGIFSYHQKGKKRRLAPLLIWWDSKEGWILRPRLKKIYFDEKKSMQGPYVLDGTYQIASFIEEAQYRYHCRVEHREPYPDDLAGYDEEYESYDI